MKSFQAALSAFILLSAWPMVGRENSPRLEQPFDAGWLFHRGDSPGAEDAAFNDASWRVLDVPHDWSIEDLPSATNSLPSLGVTRGVWLSGKGSLCAEAFAPVGPFSPDSPGGASTGYVLGGTGWYRKHFALGAENAGRLASVLFDGVYMDAEVWLNGQHLGNHPYGYTPFAFDLTSNLRPPGETNVLAVRVRNLGKNSRWYSGSGIYRHVRLTDEGQWLQCHSHQP
jgi:beta-galactosidase